METQDEHTGRSPGLHVLEQRASWNASKADKENEFPSESPVYSSQKHQLRASARLLSPASMGSSVRQSGLRRRSVGKLSPEQAKQIVLKALGTSPSREALARFVGGLSKDERRLFLGNSSPKFSISVTPKSNGLRSNKDAPANTNESVSSKHISMRSICMLSIAQLLSSCDSETKMPGDRILRELFQWQLARSLHHRVFDDASLH